MGNRRVKALIPASLRRRIRAASGVDALRSDIRRLEERMSRLETQLHESREEAWERSRSRWRQAVPTPNLTWDAEIGGEAFIDRAQEHGVFGEGRTILEIGPGYGRLLAACLDRGLKFRRYIGVDLSANNVRYLRERFDDERVSFLEGDVERVELDQKVDAVISSLTFKHLFPSFEGALHNLSNQLRNGGPVVFDLIEGERRYFEDDDLTYIRWYTRGEVEKILAATGFEVAAFDEVRHVPEMSRLLVVGRAGRG
jgi:SAM-dependent methyltransferase